MNLRISKFTLYRTRPHTTPRTTNLNIANLGEATLAEADLSSCQRGQLYWSCGRLGFLYDLSEKTDQGVSIEIKGEFITLIPSVAL